MVLIYMKDDEGLGGGLKKYVSLLVLVKEFIDRLYWVGQKIH